MVRELWCCLFCWFINTVAGKLTEKSFSPTSNLTLTVYYESKCPYSRIFLTQQVYPTWLKLDTSKLILELIPYGNAMSTPRSDGGWDFVCHHGTGECEENIWQACALEHLKDSTSRALAFITCLMAQSFKTVAEEAAKRCSYLTSKSELDELRKCSIGKEGEDLHHQYGIITHELKPQPQFLPWILFNQVSDSYLMDAAYNDLPSVVCKLLHPVPSGCGNSTESELFGSSQIGQVHQRTTELATATIIMHKETM